MPRGRTPNIAATDATTFEIMRSGRRFIQAAITKINEALKDTSLTPEDRQTLQAHLNALQGIYEAQRTVQAKFVALD